ncbi:MAG TPA: hypothetical protein DCK87_05190 [Desulfotomaculum sp.]|nr:hypothetical protein [Desulfotomaculum sp.]
MFKGCSRFLVAVFVLSTLAMPGHSYQRVIFDAHTHSKYSDESIITKGREIKDMVKDIQKILGADQGAVKTGFAVTDHSDVVVKKGLIRLRALFTEKDWKSRQEDISRLGSSGLVIPGEEVTVGRQVGTEKGGVVTHGHLLAYGMAEMLPHPFDPPLNLESDPDDPEDKQLPETVWNGIPPRKDVWWFLKDLQSSGGFGYIAHPNGGPYWKDNWTSHAWQQIKGFTGKVVKGFEIFSGGADHSVQYRGSSKSKAWREWAGYLKQGQNFFVVGGSDNHNKGILSPKIGSSFTYLLLDDSDDPNNPDNAVRALRKGRTVASQGPFVNLIVTTPEGEKFGPGDIALIKKGEEVTVNINWEPGTCKEPILGALLTVYRCTKGSKEGIQPIPGWDQKNVSEHKSLFFPFQVKEDQFIFAKLEVLPIDSGIRAYTSPVHLDPPGVKRPVVDVALVIDCSGSMQYNDPDGLRKVAAKQFIDLVQPGDKIAVIGFNDSAYVFGALQEVNTPEDRETLKQAVDETFDWGGTDIGDGLLTGKDELEIDVLPEVRKAIILLTDGEQTADPYENEHLLCQEKGIKVYTIGLGEEADTVLLQRIAQETGGRYLSASDATALTSIYNELSVAIAGGQTKVQEKMLFTVPGEVKTKPLTIDPGTLQATFGISWPGSDFEISLVRPDGRELNPSSPDPDYSFVKGPTYAYYIVDNPESGEWLCRITALELPPEGEEVNLSLIAIEQTPPEVNMEGFDQQSILKEPATVTASAYDPDGFSELYFFLDDGEIASYSVDTTQSVVYATYTLDPQVLPDGRHVLTAWAADSNFTSAGIDLDFIIDNVLPVADAGPDLVVKVGEEVIFDAGNSKDLAYCIWDFGDGTVEPGYYQFGAHAYSLPGTYIVRLTVYDDVENQSYDETTVTVTDIVNTPPDVGEVTVTPNPAPVNTSVSTYVYFTDPDNSDTHTATWDWGDGTNSPGTVNETICKVTGDHQYTAPGVYTVRVAVSDSGSGTGEALYHYVVIYDPEGGFVTGGGWINSPAGAYTANPTLTGKAIFGFVSKYQKGANIPTGQTEFQFKVADLNFHSTSYNWLVISGVKAQYKGTGTINGTGEYGFMLSAIDGDLRGSEPDKFRIKIWDKAKDIVVYDNQMGTDENAEPSTVIGGGSIVIHKE